MPLLYRSIAFSGCAAPGWCANLGYPVFTSRSHWLQAYTEPDVKACRLMIVRGTCVCRMVSFASDGRAAPIGKATLAIRFPVRLDGNRSSLRSASRKSKTTGLHGQQSISQVKTSTATIPLTMRRPLLLAYTRVNFVYVMIEPPLLPFLNGTLIMA